MPEERRCGRCPRASPPAEGSRPHTPSVWDFLAELLFDPFEVVGEVRDRRRERAARERARTTKITCALRVVDGLQPGLGRRWTRGAARVPRGTLVFEPDSGWRGGRSSIPVHSVTLQPLGGGPRRGLRGTSAPTRLIVLVTAVATLEWTVPEDQLQRSMGVASTEPVSPDRS